MERTLETDILVLVPRIMDGHSGENVVIFGAGKLGMRGGYRYITLLLATTARIAILYSLLIMASELHVSAAPD